ncbi:MAG TPA: archease [Anaerolineales bacterium]|nr:archease [Anaerolineales bacterium]
MDTFENGFRGQAGFREHPHTADWELEVWAADLPGLLEQAARGMLHLAGARALDTPRTTLSLRLTAADVESLLVSFLGELLFKMEQDGLVFSGFDLQVESLPEDAGLALNANLLAQPLLSLDKEIKAVTYHHLHVQAAPEGLRTRIVFDV